MVKGEKGSAQFLHDDQNIVDAAIYGYQALENIARQINESDLEGIAMALGGEQLREPVGPALNRIADALDRIADALTKE